MKRARSSHTRRALTTASTALGLLGLAILGLLAAEGRATQAESQAEEPVYTKQVTLAYTVNNLGYISTCG